MVKIKCDEKEVERLKEMLKYEEALYKQGITLIAGVDEVGRGPLAGPVVTSAVILPQGLVIPGVNDSKKLSQAKREFLYEKIMDEAIAIGIGIVDEKVIDEINILNATKKAMVECISALKIQPEHVLIDALAIDIDIEQTSIIKGDAQSHSIAAASIIAKVTRDKIMQDYDKIYMGYGFAQNKGYGTALHIAAIKTMGLCHIHRKSFTKNFMGENGGE